MVSAHARVGRGRGSECDDRPLAAVSTVMSRRTTSTAINSSADVKISPNSPTIMAFSLTSLQGAQKPVSSFSTSSGPVIPNAIRPRMGVLKGTASSRFLDDEPEHYRYTTHSNLPQHIDPRKLVCDQCLTPASYCCTGQCAPPSKRRATTVEVDRLSRPLSPASCDEASIYDMVEDCCFESCDDTACPESSTIPCAGDTHCPSKTACSDPECEGAPCFQPECESPPCTEPDCPDNTCEEGEPCLADACQFDPWDCCDIPHTSDAFLDPAFSADHWAQFHSNEPYNHMFTDHGGASTSQHLEGPHQDYSLNQTNFEWYPTNTLSSQISPTLLNVADTLNNIEASGNHLSAAESLALFQGAPKHDNFAISSCDLQNNATSSTSEKITKQLTNFTNFGPNYAISDRHYIPSHNSNILPNPSQTPSSTTDQSTINSPMISDCDTSLYGYYQNLDSFPMITTPIPNTSNASATAIQVKSEPDHDTDTSFVCRWVSSGTTSICNHTCTSSSDLQTHIRDAHVRPMKGELRCQWHGCRNHGDFKQRSKLTRHVQTHAGYRPHVCTWPGCGQRFGTKQTMDNHLKTHEQVKPYQCRFCGVTATTPTQIKTHENSVHLCRKRFKCRFCAFACTDSSNLSKHEKTHRRRTFKCLHPGCSFKPDCRWENAKRHFTKSGHCPEILVKGSEAQEQYKREAMAAAAAAAPIPRMDNLGPVVVYMGDD